MAKDFVTYDEIEIGAKASFSKTISESDVYQFAGITGDFNELHINQVAAEVFSLSVESRPRMSGGQLGEHCSGNEISGEGNDIS